MTDLLAETLAEALDALAGGESLEAILARYPAREGELAPLLAAALQVRALPAPALDAAFRRNARLRLLNRAAFLYPAERRAAPPSRVETLTRQLSRLLAGLTAVFALLLAGGALSYAAGSALPGDALYGTKLALENAQLLATSNAEDAILLTQHASNRLTEIQLLTVQGRYEDIPRAAQEFQANVDAAATALAGVARSDTGSVYPVLVQMQQNLDAQAQALVSLLAIVPPETRPAIEQAIMAAHLFSNGGGASG